MGLDPTYLYDNANVVWYGTEGYQNALSALMEVSGKSETAVELMLNGKYGAADYWTAMEALKDNGVVTAYNTNGYRCFAYADDVVMTAPTGPMSQLNSNATSTTLVKAAPAYDVVVDSVESSPTYGKVVTNPIGQNLSPSHGFHGWKFFAGECMQAVSAVSAGIALGKAIDSTLYNLNPNFWDSVGMSSLNPETWASITNGDDSFAAGLFNMVFGIDPNTGNSQAFLDENAMAYLSYYMNTQGIFNEPQTGATVTPQSTNFDRTPSWFQNDINNGYIRQPYIFTIGNSVTAIVDSTFTYVYTISGNSSPVYLTAQMGGGLIALSASSFSVTSTKNGQPHGSARSRSTASLDGSANFHYAPLSDVSNIVMVSIPVNPINANNRSNGAASIWYMINNGEISTIGGVDGISNQPDATLPDVSDWNDVPSTLQSLQNQYPSLWDNAVPNTIVQPDGTTQTINYIPVPMPNANGQWDTQPTSSTSSQTNPQVQPQPNPTPENNDLLKLLLQLVTMPQPQPDTETQTDTEMPSDTPDIPDIPNTGTGDSPTPVAPSGSASALWSVYHPTQAQINSFGAWLWGSPFLTDIGKLFQNPIDGVISLHKIYAPPVDSGSGTIVVGTLDSEVSSATVTQQYVTVNCGSVDCQEVFGTVFDYPPHTKVSLYLPFIGIVNLDTNDVMRSTINVTYGVDVFTGACLAMVEVTRDGNTVNLYQYAGVCAVSYPLGNVQQSQLFSGLLAIAGGVAASVASGGVGAPAALAMVGGAGTAAQSSIGRSGGFSGNAGAMGIKKPYLILQRPQTKVADAFPRLSGYPTNYSCRVGDCTNHLVAKEVHVSGINATDKELKLIEQLLKSGVEV